MLNFGSEMVQWRSTKIPNIGELLRLLGLCNLKGDSDELLDNTTLSGGFGLAPGGWLRCLGGHELFDLREERGRGVLNKFTTLSLLRQHQLFLQCHGQGEPAIVTGYVGEDGFEDG